jgi:hypothetical protein
LTDAGLKSPASVRQSINPVDFEIDMPPIEMQPQDIEFDIQFAPASATKQNKKSSEDEADATDEEGEEGGQEDESGAEQVKGTSKQQRKPRAVSNDDDEAIAASKKRRAGPKMEVNKQTELSSEYIRACLQDTSDTWGNRPTVPLSKRARLLSYRNHPGVCAT